MEYNFEDLKRGVKTFLYEDVGAVLVQLLQFVLLLALFLGLVYVTILFPIPVLSLVFIAFCVIKIADRVRLAKQSRVYAETLEHCRRNSK